MGLEDPEEEWEEDDGGAVPEAGPQGWRPPVVCPRCGGYECRMVTMEYEVSVYECVLCGVRFELDEPLE